MRFTPLLALVALTLVAPLRFAAAAETNHNFAKWEKEIEAFESRDLTNPPPKHCVLFTGSSTIRLWTNLVREFPGQPVVGRGVGGCEIVDITHFADRIVFPYEPEMIFLRCGGNDLFAGKSAEEVFGDFKNFVATIRAKLPDTEIVFMSQNPTLARIGQSDREQALNKFVKEFCKQGAHLQYCELSDMVLDKDGKVRPELFRADKLHFNDGGNKLMADRVRPFLPK